MRASSVVLLLVALVGCQREPAIVIRFDPVDARLVHDAAVSVDAASTIADAAVAMPVVDKMARRPSGATGPCTTDADCTVVTEGCCDCANGGKLVATTKRAAAQQAKKDCKDTMCTMMVSTDPSCGKRPACIAGTCGLRDARPDEQKAPRLKLPQ